MIVPAVMFIEMAIEQLNSREVPFIQDEIKEFNMLGDGRLNKLRTSLNPYTDIQIGYILGLEVARILLSGNLAAVQAKVEI